MIYYKDENVYIEKKYALESVDNKKDWERICNDEVFNPWELYKTSILLR
jgi:hypothetical protein